MDGYGSSLIHERKDRKMEPFYWILTFEVMAFLLVLAAALAAGPVALLLYHPAWWGFVLLVIGAALAILLMRFTLRYLAKLIRKNTRLNVYRVYEDSIAYILYDEERIDRREDRIPLEKVEMACVSLYVAEQSYHYKKTGWKERVPAFELLPVLYLVYRDTGSLSRRVLTVPFYGDDAIDRWLGALQQCGTLIRATDELLLPRPEALKALDDGGTSAPFAYEGDFGLAFEHFMEDVRCRAAEDDSSEDEKDIAPGMNRNTQVPGHLEPVPGGSNAGWLRYPSIALLVLIVASLYPIVLLEEAGFYPGISIVLCFALPVVAALAYFYRMPRLTVWAPIRFAIVVFFGWIVFGLSLETRGDVAYEATVNAAGAAVLQPILVWLPFGAAVWLRRRWPAAYHLRRRQAKREDAGGSAGEGDNR